MDQIMKRDSHPTWKHAKSGKVYTLMGYGVWRGSVNDPATDCADVIVARTGEGIGDFDAVPGHYTVGNVRSADMAIMQTTQPLQYGDVVVIYTGPHYNDPEDAVYARRYDDFFDGRFVKVDDKGAELNPLKLPKGRPEGNPPGPIDPPSPPPLKVG
jgi:hypothetical protein